MLLFVPTTIVVFGSSYLAALRTQHGNVGTSLFQIIFVTANSTLLHAGTNQTVDIVLALVLLLGAVVGAQFGSRLGARLRGEELRILLAFLVLLVCAKLAHDLLVAPSDPYSTSLVFG